MEECRSIITQFGVGEVTAAQVARVLGMMARTHSGLTDGIPLQVKKNLKGALAPSKNRFFAVEHTTLLGAQSVMVTVERPHQTFIRRQTGEVVPCNG